MNPPPLPTRVRWAVALLAAGAILLASVADPPSADPVTYGPFGRVPLDKWVHAAAYAGLAGALAYALDDGARPVTGAVVAAVVVAIAYGAGIEAVQHALPARTFDLVDVAANAVGAVAAGGFWAGAFGER